MLSVWFNHFINIFFRQILGKPLNSSYDYTHPFFRPIKFKEKGHTDLSQYKKENNNTHIARHEICNFLSRKGL